MVIYLCWCNGPLLVQQIAKCFVDVSCIYINWKVSHVNFGLTGLQEIFWCLFVNASHTAYCCIPAGRRLFTEFLVIVCQHPLCCILLYSCCLLSQQGILLGVCLSTTFVLHIAVFLCKLSLKGILQVSVCQHPLCCILWYSCVIRLTKDTFRCLSVNTLRAAFVVLDSLGVCRLFILWPCLHGSGAITLVTV